MKLKESINFCEEKSKNIKLRTEPETFVCITEYLKDLEKIKEITENWLDNPISGDYAMEQILDILNHIK